MNKKKIIINNNLWWLDYSILNINNIKFKYYYFNNIFYIKLLNFFFFFLINKNNLNNSLFYNLDAVITNNINNKYYIAMQTFFYDLQILLEIKFANKLDSLSKIYLGNTWIERELKENNNIFFKNLLDNRKLLSNYNLNNNIEYNQFNSIINDIKIINMLFWLKFFLIYIYIVLIIFNLYLNNLMSTLLNIEFITILIFFVYIFSGSIFNLNWIFGFSFIILILGGLEIALSFLLLNL